MLSQRNGKYSISTIKCRGFESAQFVSPARLITRPALFFVILSEKKCSSVHLTPNKISLSEIKKGVLSVHDMALHPARLPHRFN